MSKTKVIGRTEEYERLNECMNSNQAQLVIVYGRRRVGKTFLINEFFHNTFAFKLTGTYGKEKEVQLRNFASSLKRQTHKDPATPKDWLQAFELLRDYLEALPQNKKQVVFFDEMPWLDNHKSDFLSSFEWFWNDWASTQDNLVFIVCGSATSWMDEKIANNKGGLFNRQTCKLFLKPFKLAEVEEYLLSRQIKWSRYDIVRCYMIMGGIPYYLSLLSNKLSLSQNIDKLFFAEDCELWDEFEHLYNTLFTNSESYIKVVESLSSKRGGLTRAEIVEKTKLNGNGDLTAVLKNLELSGFIRVSNFYKKAKKDSLYQLRDYFTAFYFQFIKNNYGKDEHFWSNSTDNPTRRTWEGLVFEQICKDHIFAIKQKLGISGILSEESAWFVRADKESGTGGAQIDLLIKRRDRVITICEIKFSNGEYLITKDYDLNLRNKVELFKSETNCKESIQLIMLTTYGVKQNEYSSVIQNQIVMDDLFNYTPQFRRAC
ncbi:MAG: AAA family ATPase [Treponemataceae bacterium]|nr:AAA family ATPase [Treponemataceae bacterium]